MSEMPPGGKRGSIGVVFVLVVFVLLEVPVPEADSVIVPDADLEDCEPCVDEPEAFAVSVDAAAELDAASSLSWLF